MTYNPNSYGHILAESTEVITIGKIKASHINMPAGYELNDNLLFQIGEAEGEDLESLLTFATRLAKELHTLH